LCELFGVTPHDRHTASCDAFITARIFLRLLRLAAKYDRNTIGTMTEVFPAE
jgi:DNA polymerase III subunit epsilon